MRKLLPYLVVALAWAAPARAQIVVDITPPTGMLMDPGDGVFWNTKGYQVRFMQPIQVTGIEWKINLSQNGTVAARIYDFGNKQLLAKGAPVAGTGAVAFLRAPINFQ